jgi:hypothetical protein
VRRFNEGMTQALSPKARALAEARTLTPETVDALGGLMFEHGDSSCATCCATGRRRCSTSSAATA